MLEFKDEKDFSDAPPIILNIFDSDKGFISDSRDYLGRSVIFLKNASYNTTLN